MAQPWKHTNGTYYLRVRIPENLQPVLRKGTHLKSSLKTKNLAEAKPLFAAAYVKAMVLFDQARLQLKDGVNLTAADTVQIATRWAEHELAEMARTGDFKPWLVQVDGGFETIGDFYDTKSTPAYLLETDAGMASAIAANVDHEIARQGLTPVPSDSGAYRHLEMAFAAQLIHLSDTALNRYNHNHVTPMATPKVAPLSFEKAPEPASKALSVLTQEWIKRELKLGNNSRDVVKRTDEYAGTVKVFIELYGDVAIHTISKASIHTFSNDLLRMPTGGKGRRGMTAPQLIAKAEAEQLPTLSKLTAKNRLNALSSILSYALQAGLLTENSVTASGVTGDLTRAAAKDNRIPRRRHYTFAELKKIFSSAVFKRTYNPPRAKFGEAWFWLPLLLCYTGARREEIAQLKASEIRRSDDGVWFVDILTTPDEDDAKDIRTVKTAGSHRKVPLHPDLIELGLVDYAANLPQHGPLFPLLEANASGYYGHNFGKRWGVYLKNVAMVEAKGVSPLHGFRHTFITMCREVSVPEELRDILTGHDNGSISRKYGEKSLLPQLHDQLLRLPSIAREVGLLPTETPKLD
ncbi:site-specific integrase [Pseudomonas sp. EL_65y_Pfl1_R32]|uniref:site-specific integrase n=1 Tax=Pseudomonas sp. EL_65y_Pfl1_R32 TaxID=3088696 RepID=UPI0030DC7481